MPSVIAQSVVSELARHLYPSWTPTDADTDAVEAHLETRANRIYNARPDLRRKFKRNPTYGRDWLYTFMRHWLTGYAKDHWPAVYQTIPQTFANGQAL